MDENDKSPERMARLMFEYEAHRGAEVRSQHLAKTLFHLQRLEHLQRVEEKQRADLIELRKCIEYINRHTNVIQSALRNVEVSDAAVPVCSSIVGDMVAVKANIQQSIQNSVEIKKMLGVTYEPLMENLLAKMDAQLNNWTSVLDVASRNLLNSRALVENIQNLIVTQQQMCSEVVESELFANLDPALNSTSVQDFAQISNAVDVPQALSTNPAEN